MQFVKKNYDYNNFFSILISYQILIDFDNYQKNYSLCILKAFSTQGFSEQDTELLLQFWRTNVHNVIQPGLSGVAGVLKDMIIHFQHL